MKSSIANFYWRSVWILSVSGVLAAMEVRAQFRVRPYLQQPTTEGVLISWVTETQDPGLLIVKGPGLEKARRYRSRPALFPQLAYSEAELKQRNAYPDMFENANYKHQVRLKGLLPGESYRYTVVQGRDRFNGSIKTVPEVDTTESIRFIVLADSETEPDGRFKKVEWGDIPELAYTRAEGSEPRPDRLERNGKGEALYVATQAEGLARNVRVIEGRKPDLLLMPGDLVQGGGYQRAWDEYFRHFAGKLSGLLGNCPVLPAFGDWENSAARNGFYYPTAVFSARQKYKAYFDTPANNKKEYRDCYYRLDYGPITILTIDSSNGQPDDTNADTQKNIHIDSYPGNDLPDFNEGSDQWNWVMAELKSASEAGQVIFVQFHHIPYSSGRHGYLFEDESPRRNGQSGRPLRAYSPYFEKYGVTAVFCGHSELFERSVVNGIHYYDVGVAGDGLRSPELPANARRNNPYSVWMAHYDAPEIWDQGKLVDGGKHYGHLEVNVRRVAKNTFRVELTPVYVFPVMDALLRIKGWERRIYNDIVVETVTVSGRTSGANE